MGSERGVRAGGHGLRGGGRATLAVCAVAAIATGAAMLPATAAARGPAPTRVEILSPSEGQRAQGGAVRVRVRVSTSRGFAATVDGRDVTRRFGPARDGVRTAVLTRGRDFATGRNRVTVAAGRGSARTAASAGFVAQRRESRLLSLTDRLQRSKRTPLRVRLAVRKGASAVTLRLNGRRIPLDLDAGRRVQRVALGADDGLRYGRNRLVAVAHRDADGTTDRETRVVSVGRATPLVGAGPHRTTRPGRAVVLDGRSTKAPRRGARLLYRWRIVEKPAGSKAGVVRSTSPVARLRPDLPGTYRLRLVAAAAPRGTTGDGAPRPRARRAQSGLTCLAPPSSSTPLERPDGGASEPLARPSQSTPPTPLSPAPGTGGFSPLSPPACVRPTGDPTPPLLPLEARPLAAVDEVTVTTLATLDPMGWPIQTIDARGNARVGPQTFFHNTSGWAKLLVLDQQSLRPVDNTDPRTGWGSGEQLISASQASTLPSKVAKVDDEKIVVITGMGVANAGIDVNATSTALAKAVATLGGVMPSTTRQQTAMRSGSWSVIGTPRSPTRTVTNLDGLTQADPRGSGGSLPGSLNGYMQVVTNDAFSYVSPEYVPIDTKATGSTNNQSVFSVGGRTYTSAYLGSGKLGLHVLVLSTDAPGAQLTPLDHQTFTLDDPYDTTYQAGTKAAAAMLQKWRSSTANALIVMQTFGEDGVAPWTAPGASASWLNDALLSPTDHGLDQWRGQPYVSAKSAADLAAKNDKLWNPGYPTVAGQVGNLTGQVGHDLVANFGAKNPDFEITRLTMIANNQPYDPSENYVDGWAAPKEGRVVGTLTRSPQGQLELQASAPVDTFGGSSLWEEAFAAPTPWLMSTTPRQRAAMAYIADMLWPGQGVTDVRTQYVEKQSDTWSDIAGPYRLGLIEYHDGLGFDRPTFDALKRQVGIEMTDVDIVVKAIGNWQAILGSSSVSGYVNLERVASTAAAQAIEDSKKRSKASASVDPLEIISEATYVAADLLGFPEATAEIKMAETIGTFASVFGFADSVFPHDESGERPEGPDISMIYAKADDLGAAIMGRFRDTGDSLDHLGDIYVSDWGKLQKAADAAQGPWAYGTIARSQMEQSLTVSAARETYQALLPITYQQWVVAPWQTISNPSGPQPPGQRYACIDYRPAYESNGTVHPFGGDSAGSMLLMNYRGSGAPASTTPPAVPYSVGYTLRALKSKANPLELQKVDLNDNGAYGITIEHSGSNPDGTMIDNLFAPLNPGDRPYAPTSLGMGKTEFYAEYDQGAPSWKRMICAQYG